MSALGLVVRHGGAGGNANGRGDGGAAAVIKGVGVGVTGVDATAAADVVSVVVGGVSGVGLHDRSWGRRGLRSSNGWGWSFWLVRARSDERLDFTTDIKSRRACALVLWFVGANDVAGAAVVGGIYAFAVAVASCYVDAGGVCELDDVRGCGYGFVVVAEKAVMDVVGAGNDVAAAAAALAGVEVWSR